MGGLIAENRKINDLGRIEAGFRANITLLDDDFQVKQVFLRGKQMI